MNSPKRQDALLEYYQQIGLGDLLPDNDSNIVAGAIEASQIMPTGMDLRSLYEYEVPETAEGLACGINTVPHQLYEVLGVDRDAATEHETTRRLYALRIVAERLYERSGANWLGLYRKTTNNKGEPILLKEAYCGKPSRAEFPLFAEHDNFSLNVATALSGVARMVEDVEQFGGPYYECDPRVKSELCMPVLSTDGDVVGIIDAESFEKAYFHSSITSLVATTARDLGANALLDDSVWRLSLAI